jgi:uncharacterized membrane protein YkvA (DUF1232 family)
MFMDVEKRAQDSEDQARFVIEDPAAVERFAEKAQEKARRNQGRLGAVRRDLETLIRMLRAWATGKYKGISVSNVIIIAGAVLYFLNPIDAIVDFLPIIGFTDDVAVITFAITRLKDEFNKFEDWEQTFDVSRESSSDDV